MSFKTVFVRVWQGDGAIVTGIHLLASKECSKGNGLMAQARLKSCRLERVAGNRSRTRLALETPYEFPPPR